MLIGLVTMRLVLKALGEVDYGVYIIVGGIVAMLDVLNANMTNTSMRYLAYSLGKKDSNEVLITFNTTVFIHYIVGFLSILVLEIGGLLLFEYIVNIPSDRISDAKIIYQFMIMTTFISVISVPYDAVINAHEKIYILSLFDVFSSLLRCGVAFIILFFAEDRLILYGLCLFLVEVILRILKVMYAKKSFNECRYFLRSKVVKERIRNILSFTGWNLFGSLSAICITQIRSLMLNFFFGVRLNASEGVSYQVTSPLNMVAVSMTRAINPQIMKCEGGENHERMKFIVEMGAKYSSFLFALFGIPVFIELPILLNLWLVEVPEYAAIFCQLTILMMLMEKLTFQIVHAINAVGNIRNFQISNAFANMLYLPFAWVLLNNGFPPITIYLLSFISYISVALLRLYFGKKVAGIAPLHYVKTAMIPIIIPLVVSSIIAYYCSLMISNQIVNIIMVFIVFCVSFVGLFWVRGMGTDERVRWRQILSRVTSKMHS